MPITEEFKAHMTLSPSISNIKVGARDDTPPY